MEFMTRFFRSQLLTSIPYPTSDFSGQTVIVTGSNTGIGLEAAKHIACLGAKKTILAVRNLDKGRAAAAKIVQSTNVSPSSLEVWALDMSSHESVKAFAGKAKALPRLDAVILNAGILTHVYSEVEGNESHITVNVVHQALLAMLLLPKLRASGRAHDTRGRLAYVGSDTHLIAKFAAQLSPETLFEALNKKEGIDMADRYSTSKLLSLFFIRAAAALSPVSIDSPVIIDYMTPGFCRSTIFRDDSSVIGSAMMDTLQAVLARTTEVGGRTLVHAVKPDLELEAHGAYIQDCKVSSPGTYIDSEKGQKMQEKFIGELFAKLESIQPGVTRI